MGTRKTGSNPKKAITHIFRGILDIIHQNHATLNQSFITHIRSFDLEPSEQELELGVVGFWRLLLELILNCYTQTVKVLGILLVFTLVLVTFPLRILGTLFSGQLFSRRFQMTEEEWAQYVQQAQQAHHSDPTVQQPEVEKPKDDSKVVRRVVYEEAKVNK